MKRRRLGKSYENQSTKKGIYRDCDKNLAFFLDSKVRERTLFIRYEDVARFPIKKAREIFGHFKMELNEEFVEKFVNATHADSDAEKTTFSVNKAKTNEEIFDGWRAYVPEVVKHKDIIEIESRCRVMMEFFGYRMNVLGQKNVSSVDPDWVLL